MPPKKETTQTNQAKNNNKTGSWMKPKEIENEERITKIEAFS